MKWWKRKDHPATHAWTVYIGADAAGDADVLIGQNMRLRRALPKGAYVLADAAARKNRM